MKALFSIAAIAALSVGGAQAAAIHTGLLSYWEFEGGYTDTAGAVAGNASTVADDGTAGSAVAIVGAGPLGSYGDFGRTALGTDNVVVVGDSADVIAAGESLSISAWFRVDGFDQNWQALVAHGENTDYRIARRSGEPTLGYAGGVGDIPGASVGPNINDGGWHHVVAITEPGVSTRLWMDGTLVATGGVPTLTDNGAGNLYIGGNPQGNAGDSNANQYRPWNGGIDDLALFDRVLSPAEVDEIYQAGLNGVSLGAIPEPSAGALIGLSALGLLRRRRR